MAGVSTRKGEVYFIRERDVVSGEISPYVKIGLTRDDRLSTERRGEHNTGNPRELFVHHAEKVDMVSTVEKTLHWHFAPKRVSGEWFVLNEGEIANAIEKCRTTASELKQHVEAVLSAERFSEIESVGEPIAATDDAREWWLRHQIADHIVGDCKTAVDGYKAVLRTEIAQGKDIGDAATVKESRNPVFDEDGFKDKYPELWNENVSEPKIRPNFTVKKLAPENYLSEADVITAKPVIAKFLSAIELYKDQQISISEVAQEYIQFLSLTEFHKTREALAKLCLQSICGSAPGIEGICTWSRVLKPGTLSRKSLQDSSPVEYAEFVSYKTVETVKPGRGAGKAAANS